MDKAAADRAYYYANRTRLCAASLSRYHARRRAGMCGACGRRPPRPQRSDCAVCAGKRSPCGVAREQRRAPSSRG